MTPMQRIQAYKHITGMLQSESKTGFLLSYNSLFVCFFSHYFIHIHTSTHICAHPLIHTQFVILTSSSKPEYLCHQFFFKHTKMYVHLSPLPVNHNHHSPSLWLKHADHAYIIDMSIDRHTHLRITHTPPFRTGNRSFWKSLIVFMNYNCGDSLNYKWKKIIASFSFEYLEFNSHLSSRIEISIHLN